MNKVIRSFTILVLILAGSLTSQEEPRDSFIRNTSLFTGAHIEYWSYNENHYFETVLPVYYSMDLGKYIEGLGLDAVASPVAGVVSGGDALYRLTGTKLRSSYNWNNLVLGTFGVQMPSGSNELSSEQTNAVGALSTRQMHFKVARIGSGWDLDFTLSSSMEPAEDFTVGLGIGLLTHGPFKPFTNAQEYNPGNEYVIVAGTEYILYHAGRKISLMGDLNYTFHTTAELDGSEIFNAGNQLSINLSAGLKLNEKFYNRTGLNLNLRGEKKYFVADRSVLNMGDDVLISNSLQFLQHKKYHPYALARVYFFGAGENPNGSERGGAVTAGLGGGGSVSLSDKMYARGNLIVDMGGMNMNFIAGFEISGGLHYDF